MKKKIKTFTDLEVWKSGRNLRILVFKASKKFPKNEDYVLTSQIKGSAISITSNIAEGFGRRSYKEKIQFYYVSQGSLNELKDQLLTAKEADYIDKKDFIRLIEVANATHKMLQGLIKKTRLIINL